MENRELILKQLFGDFDFETFIAEQICKSKEGKPTIDVTNSILDCVVYYIGDIPIVED